MLHYGAFPFPTQKGDRLTQGTFLRGIYMISRMKNRVLWKDYGYVGGERPTRLRLPVDDVRLLFQSLASKSALPTQHKIERNNEDDEDLLDVLFVAIRRVGSQRNPKWGFKRRSVIRAAARLPSSRSRDMQGTISYEDLRCLLELVVAMSSTRIIGLMPPPPATVIDHMLASFFPNDQKISVNWAVFSDVVLGTFVSRLVFRSCNEH